MASLDKLAIRNIRSFNNISVIQFYTPLTVIVGQNGSGKTTIIECLNYITTGNMPPNTKGGAFVHDPKLAGEKDVKAQVRLRFYDANGDRYNVVRNLQVTTKKGGNLSMSTLEGLLQIDMEDKDKVGGKRKRNTTISTRCAELDEEIPRLLGVSTSILENVIFCHQEDSNWPLSEPAKLKMKFDNIFEATRYTKALKHIKDLHKERVADAKADKVRLESLREDRSRATSIRDRKAKLEAERVAKDEAREDLERQCKRIQAENITLADAHDSFREKLAQAEALEDKSNMLRENMKALEDAMTVIEATDDELQSRKDHFQNHLTTQQQKSKALEQRITERKAAQSKVADSQREEFARKRTLEGDQKRHVEAVKARKELIRRISIEAGIKGYDMDALSENEVDEFIVKLHSQADKAERGYDSLKIELRTALAALEDKHSEAQGDVKAKRVQLSGEHETIRKANVDIKRLEDDLEDLDMSEHEREAAKKRVEEHAAKLQEARDHLARADYDERIRTLNIKLREAEEAKDEANVELTSLNAHADFRARLALKEAERDSKRESLESLMNKSDEIMQRLVGRAVDAHTFERDVERLTHAKDDELAESRRSRAADERQLQQLEFTLSSKRRQVQEKETMIADVESKVDATLRRGDEQFGTLETLIARLEATIAEEQEITNVAEGALHFLESVVKKGHQDHICFTCNRTLDADEMDAFDKKTTALLKRYQQYRTADATRKVQRLNDEVSALKALQIKAEEVRTMKSQDVARMKEEIKDDEERMEKLKQVLETSTGKIDALEREAKELASLKRNSVEASRTATELKSIETDISRMQDDFASAGIPRSLEEVNATIAQLTDDIKETKRKLKSATDERDAARVAINQAERDLHRAEIEQRDQEQKYEHRRTKLAELKSLKQAMSEAKEAVKRIETEMNAAVSAQRRAYETLDSARSEHDRRMAAAQKQANALQQHKSQLVTAGQAVEEWLRKRGEEQLLDCDRKMSELQEEMERISRDIAVLETQKATIDADLQQARATERNLDDNIRYRSLARSLDEIKGQINDDELRRINESRMQYLRKYEIGRERENKVSGDIQHLRGVIQGLGDQIAELAKDLKTHYGNIDKKFTEQLVKYKTNELANLDLEKTAKAVDAAILKYHSIKMEEINEHIRYLWSKTYQGTDIDTIMIKSDPDGGKSTKSYNYRVCMVKDTVEMDMRGRCSAGQKVLASIIIRLALADSFSTNCAILALDEPTTNLDKDNIDALAASLADLIKERRQANFQLIVITHDEDFLGRLGQQDVIEYYWRVSRDSSQKSEITRHRLSA